MLTRREFLQYLGLSAITAGFAGLQTFVQEADAAVPSPDFLDNIPYKTGYGELFADKDNILKLPKGFSYKIIARAGETMTDGFLRPGRPDGMGTFKGSNGKVIVVCNHENSANQLIHSPFGQKNQLFKKMRKNKIYDAGFGKFPHLGGTTTFVYNEITKQIDLSYLSLAGTSRNCAGGITPWGSWLTCEEDMKMVDDTNQKRHGYVFEVPASESIKPKTPVAIPSMGRFNHEAVAVDPDTGIVYLTEDRHEGLFYRFIPKVKGKLHEGGRLQALAFVWKNALDSRNWGKTPNIKQNIPYAAKWVTLSGVDGEKDDLRYRGFKQGAACFARGEGIWFGNNELYFACTNGGKTKTGQIFRYKPSRYEGTKNENIRHHRPTIELFAEPNNIEQLRYCDNLTIAPWGDIVFCEDNSTPRIVGITPKGKFYHIAQNIGYKSELAGVCFSPSGKTLFVNIQDAGLTLAITGNWEKR